MHPTLIKSKRGLAAAAVNYYNAVQQNFDLGLSPDHEAMIADKEVELSGIYIDKATNRLQTTLDNLLLTPSEPDEDHLTKWHRAIQAERRYTNLHIQETKRRLSAAKNLADTIKLSPSGAFWNLNPHKDVHAPECTAMANQAWPWEVLSRNNPYLHHHGCGCYLTPLQLITRDSATPADDITNPTNPTEEAVGARFSRKLGKYIIRHAAGALKPSTHTFAAKLKEQQRMHLQDLNLGGHFANIDGNVRFLRAGKIGKTSHINVKRHTVSSSRGFISERQDITKHLPPIGKLIGVQSFKPKKKVPLHQRNVDQITHKEIHELPGTMADEGLLRHAFEADFQLDDGTKVYTQLIEVQDIEGFKGGLRHRAVGVILDQRGNQIGDFVRISTPLESGGYSIEHAYLSIESKFQGQGFASAFNERAFKFYEVKNVKHVELNADSTVGGFAWSRRGFDFDRSKYANDAWAVVNNRAVGKDAKNYRFEDLNGISDNLTLAEVRSYVLQVESNKNMSAWELSNLGRDEPWVVVDDIQRWNPDTRKLETIQTERAMWFGKAVMLESDWDGIMEIMPMDPDDITEEASYGTHPPKIPKTPRNPLVKRISKVKYGQATEQLIIRTVHRMWVRKMVKRRIPFELQLPPTVYPMHYMDVEARPLEEASFYDAVNRAITTAKSIAKK